MTFRNTVAAPPFSAMTRVCESEWPKTPGGTRCTISATPRVI